MARYQNILETIGNTPLVKLNKLAPPGVNVYVKVESFNPMGSVKDRMARAVIEDAERSGALKPGTDRHRSHQRQHRHRSRDGVRAEGLSTGGHHGRELQRRAPQAAALPRREGGADAGRREGQRHAGQGGRACREAHGWFLCRQFENQANADVHTRTTAREILEDFANERLDYFVTGFGTGGTLQRRGARAASERGRHQGHRRRAGQLTGARQPHPAAAQRRRQPSSGSHPRFRPHLMQGWAPDFISTLTEEAVAAGLIDEIVPVAGNDALRLSRELARQEGIFVGTSSGATLAAALTVARRAPPGSNIVCMLPDTGERYLSTPLFEGIGEEMTAEELGRVAFHALVPLRCAARPRRRRTAPVGRANAPSSRPVAARFVAEVVDDEPVVMFALEWCEFCWSVRKLFTRLGIDYRSVDVDSVEYQQDDLGGKIRAVLADRTGAEDHAADFRRRRAHRRLHGPVRCLARRLAAETALDENGVHLRREVELDPYSLLPKWLQPRKSA